MGALPVAVREELCEAKTNFEERSAVAERSLQCLPQRYALVRERNYFYPHEAFPDGLLFAKLKRQGEIDHQYDHIDYMRQIEQGVPCPLVRNISVPK